MGQKLIDAATCTTWRQEAVKIDFSGYTAETLHNAIQKPLRQVSRGPADAAVDPVAVAVGHVGADCDPVAVGNEPGDDPRVRARMARTAQRYAGGIADSVAELADLQLVQSAGVQVKVHSSAPLFKLYLINEHDLFWGFYPVIAEAGHRHIPLRTGDDVTRND